MISPRAGYFIGMAVGLAAILGFFVGEAHAEVNLPPMGQAIAFHDEVLGCDTPDQVRQIIDAKVAGTPAVVRPLFQKNGPAEPACVLGKFQSVTIVEDVEHKVVLVAGIAWEVHILKAKSAAGFEFYILLPFKQPQQGGA